MKIKFLGTAAAEGWPAIFCDCPACQKARKLQGKDIRTRFSILIDERYKVDFPPDAFHHALQYQLNYLHLEHIFITHPHSDHLAGYEFEFLRSPYTNARNHKLNIYGWETSMDEIKKGMIYEDCNFPILHNVEAFDIIDTPDFFVHVLPADHMQKEDHPYFYLFERKSDKKTFLCAHDTGYFFESVWQYLQKFKIDVVSIDCTYGLKDNYRNHLGGMVIVEIKNRLTQMNILKENCRFFVNHFSHNGGKMHDEMEQFYQPYQIEVAYDGLEIEF